MRGLIRALLARCPVCGTGGIWETYGDPRETCPGCGYRFAREEGYWVGGLIVNMAFTLFAFFCGFVLVLIATFPDVPWNFLLVFNVLLIAATPALLYRQSKMVWVWLDQRIHPYAAEERDWEQASRAEGRDAG